MPFVSSPSMCALAAARLSVLEPYSQRHAYQIHVYRATGRVRGFWTFAFGDQREPGRISQTSARGFAKARLVLGFLQRQMLVEEERGQHSPWLDQVGQSVVIQNSEKCLGCVA